MTAPKPRDPAKARFIAMQAVRWTGLGLFALGLAVVAGKTDVPIVVGYPLVIFGLFDAVVMPRILARRWSSRK